MCIRQLQYFQISRQFLLGWKWTAIFGFRLHLLTSTLSFQFFSTALLFRVLYHFVWQLRQHQFGLPQDLKLRNATFIVLSMVPRRMFSFPLVQACFASLGFQETFPIILSVFRPPYKHKSLKTDQEKWAGLAFEGKKEEQDSPKGTHTHTHTQQHPDECSYISVSVPVSVSKIHYQPGSHLPALRTKTWFLSRASHLPPLPRALTCLC